MSNAASEGRARRRPLTPQQRREAERRKWETRVSGRIKRLDIAALATATPRERLRAAWILSGKKQKAFAEDVLVCYHPTLQSWLYGRKPVPLIVQRKVDRVIARCLKRASEQREKRSKPTPEPKMKRPEPEAFALALCSRARVLTEDGDAARFALVPIQKKRSKRFNIYATVNEGGFPRPKVGCTDDALTALRDPQLPAGEIDPTEERIVRAMRESAAAHGFDLPLLVPLAEMPEWMGGRIIRIA